MVYSLENVRKLKEATGIGIKKCMEALNKNNNDFEKSLDWLKKYSVSVRNLSSSEREESASFGTIFLGENGNNAVSFILSCESDFAEKSEPFRSLSEEIGSLLLSNFESVIKFSQVEKEVEELVEEKISSVSLSIKEKISVKSVNFFTKKSDENFGLYLHHNKKLCSLAILKNSSKEIAHEIALQVAVSKPIFISRDFIPHRIIESKITEIKEKNVSEINEKSLPIVEKIIEGKLNKWYSDVCLLEKPNFRNNELSVGEILSSSNSKVEKIFFEKI